VFEPVQGKQAYACVVAKYYFWRLILSLNLNDKKAAQIGTELRPPARALHDHDQSLGHVQRHVGTPILAQQVQGQIDAGDHTGGGVEALVLYVDAIGLDPGVLANGRRPTATSSMSKAVPA